MDVRPCYVDIPGFPQGGLLADEKFLPALLRAYRRAPPPPVATASSVTTAGGAGQLQKQSGDRSRSRVDDRFEDDAQGASADDGGSDGHEYRGRDERGGLPAAPVGHVDGVESGKVADLEQPASAEVGNETSADLGINGTPEAAPSSGGESGPTQEEGVAAESLSVSVVRQSSSGSSSSGGDGRGGGGGLEHEELGAADIDGVAGAEDEDLGAADIDGVAGAGALQDTAPPRRKQQEDPGVAEGGQEGEEGQDGRGNGLQHETEDSNGELSYSVTEPGGGSSNSVETGVAEQSAHAAEANEPAAEAAQEEGSPSPPPSSDAPSSESAAVKEAVLAPSPEDSSHDVEVPSKGKRGMCDDSSDGHSIGTASPSPKEGNEGGPPQEEEHVGGPEGEAPSDPDRDDEGDGSGAGSNEGGGAPDVGSAASGGRDANVDVTAGGGARALRGANNVGSVLAAEKPFRERAASWAWMIASWRNAGGKHH